MKKIYQTIVDPEKGNCMQAAIASLFEKELSEVPNFIELGEDWYLTMDKYYMDNGYEHITPFHINRGSKKKEVEFVKTVLKHDQGVNGFFYATVPSQTFKDVTHAVIVDIDLNVVHDPNPNQKALELGPEDVISVDTVKDDWYIDIDGKFVIGNWRT